MHPKLPEIPKRVLFVDDEENVLRSLRRLFVGEDFDVLTASSGAEGLGLLRQREVPVIISDQRMPGMNGAEFLEQSRSIAPHALRVILTGYADVEAAISAINRGGAYRYITKPWNDGDLVLVVRDAWERYRLYRENAFLLELTRQQNAELKKWSTELEGYVQQHTIELTRQNKQLQQLNERLRKNVADMIASFSSLIELRGESMHSHSNAVSSLAQDLARRLGLPADEIETIRVAALLHDIGKIGSPDISLFKQVDELSPEEKRDYLEHPVRGQAAIDVIEDLRPAGILIRHHHERTGGGGFPDGLRGDAIPLGSRIISMADVFDRLFHRMGHGTEGTLRLMAPLLASQLDALLFKPFIETAKQIAPSSVAEGAHLEFEIPLRDLKPDMVLARDVRSGTGLLLLRKDTVLNGKNIESLRRAHHLDPSKSGIFVRHAGRRA